MTDNNGQAQIPAGNGDLVAPTVQLLNSLNLLPSHDDLKEAGDLGAVFSGPPQSVALIEAGATALSKWWAIGGAAAVGGVWLGVKSMWNSLPELRSTMLYAGAALSVGLILGVAYLLASDVRGRAAVMTETVIARQHVAREMVVAAAGRPAGTAAPAEPPFVAIPGFREVTNLSSANNPGWRLLAVRQRDGQPEYLAVNGTSTQWVSAANIRFD